MHIPLYPLSLTEYTEKFLSVQIGSPPFHEALQIESLAFQLKLYKFSISWARLLPTADASAPNPLAVKYYNDLLNEVIAHNMTPVVSESDCGQKSQYGTLPKVLVYPFDLVE